MIPKKKKLRVKKVKKSEVKKKEGEKKTNRTPNKTHILL